MIIEISVAVVAIAFAALVVYLIRTLKSVTELLSQTNVTMKEIQGQIGGISVEATELLRHTNEVTVDVRNKLQSIDPVVYSVKNIGDAVQEVTDTVKEATAAVAGSIRKNVPAETPKTGEAIGRIIQAVPMLLEIWHTWKGTKKSAVARTN
ncbi:Uncharacterized protein YoxC, contains an MCP-like domain [Paenibacillus sp. UNCCL117]|uniref:DUF948 domain-containing protein n=1 Tax=unclassified Paenibacillus TaxID=185978 RepID=UPI0008909CAF|nr:MULTISPECIES: DUF948 domain-containing protein [unclassified Paenibacillus]SDE07848.1 Uncharacterized protein YoxC, contains an MCP-like domain [Paenibacillus sp. cl123]SFW59086.1 Uncharacterized protein YoxC, contains an MCP-like domain [Paenibacillus sp. UNCCL117]